MFAILIDESSLELITAMNNGMAPVVEGDTFFVVDGDTVPDIITSEELRKRLDTETGWSPLDFRIWKK